MAGLISPSLPDDQVGNSLIDDDEIEVAVLDEPESEITLSPRRGQNEPDDSDDRAWTEHAEKSEDDLDGIDNPNIRNRIMRERRIAREAREQLVRSEEAHQQALYESELSKLQIQRDSAKLSLDGVDMHIRTAMEALKLAKTDGDVAAEVEIQNQLRQMERARETIVAQQSALPDENQLRQRFDSWRQQRRAQLGREAPSEPGVKANAPMAQKWADQNPWVNKTEHSSAQSYLVAEANKLAQSEGLDMNSVEFYAELSRRVAKRFPELPIRDLSGRSLTGRPPAARTPGGPPVASARVTTQKLPDGKSRTRVDLDGNDRRMIRIMGLDPADKAVRERFAREKLSRLRNDQQAGR